MSSSNECIKESATVATVVDPGHDNDRHEDDLLSFEDAVDESCGCTTKKEAEPEKVKVIVNVPTTTTSTTQPPQLSAKDLQLVPLVVPEIRFNLSSSSLVEIPLHESDIEEDHEVDGGMGDDLEDDEVDDGEHADHLSPLMIDNHTIVEHHECFQQQHSPTAPDFPPPVMVVDSAGNITVMRHSDTKDSLSSVDSDLGMSFDRHQGPSNHSSNGNSSPSSDQDPSRDSGCETGPCIPMRPYCPVEVDEGVDANAGDDEDDLNDDESQRPFQIPDDEFSERIVEQVEFYFSNDNILKDAFLLKHVRRNKEGFVSLKLVSSFKRVRQLTKDWRVVGHAVRRKSQTVELNDLGTKVRRLEALPNYDETMPSRTVVATDLALDKITIEKVYEMFSKCGEIALVRILRVGGPIPADVRQFINKYPELLQKECALVEFVESKSARNALAFEGITVLEMIAPKKKTGKKAPLTRMLSDSSQPPSSIIMYGPASGGGGMDGERSRGGAPLENSTPPRFQMRRNSAGYYNKPDQVMYVPPPRKFGYSSGANPGFAYSNNNNNAGGGLNNQRNSSAGYHHPPAVTHYQPQYQQYQGHPNQQQQHVLGQPPSQNVNYHHQVVQHQTAAPPAEAYEVYEQHRPSSHMVAIPASNKTHEPSQRRYSNCSDTGAPLDSRRGSKVSVGTPPGPPAVMHECQCNCQANAPRRISLQNSNDLMYRRISQSSLNSPQLESPRKLSAHSAPFERKVSTTETNWRNEAPAPERKYSNDQMTTVQYHQPHHHHYHQGHYQTMPESPIRKYSNGFDPLRKLSDTDEYVNGRRISTDSGYDRKFSFSSDSSNVRSRSNSFICNHNPVEQIIRTPVGPAGDGSRGFGTRTRKIGHILPPV